MGWWCRLTASRGFSHDGTCGSGRRRRGTWGTDGCAGCRSGRGAGHIDRQLPDAGRAILPADARKLGRVLDRRVLATATPGSGLMGASDPGRGANPLQHRRLGHRRGEYSGAARPRGSPHYYKPKRSSLQPVLTIARLPFQVGHYLES